MKCNGTSLNALMKLALGMGNFSRLSVPETKATKIKRLLLAVAQSQSLPGAPVSCD